MRSVKKRYSFPTELQSEGISNELAMYCMAAGKVTGASLIDPQPISSPATPTGTVKDPLTQASLSETQLAQPSNNITIPAEIKLPTGTTTVTQTPTGIVAITPVPAIGGFGGGFGVPSSGPSKDESVASIEVKSKNSIIFPLLLIATGIYIIVKKPF